MAILFYPKMKCLLINLFVFVTVVNSNSNKRLFLPQLPVGPYRINFLGMMRCVSGGSNYKINYNWYPSKKSANTTEIKGNITSFIPFDDSLNMEINLAIKDSIGGWKENAVLYKSPKACSSIKMLLGDAWIPFMAGAGVPNATCPIPEGIFLGRGIYTAVVNLSNFPKTFFYGTYRFRVYYTKNNEVFGCVIMVIKLKRSWETN